MDNLLDNIVINTQSSIKMKFDKVIYFDPYCIDKEYNDADVIFITHAHYDHFSLEDILKVKKESTKIVIPSNLLDDTKRMNFSDENILCVEPNNEYEILGISFKSVSAYNVDKEFHLKEYNWVGYVINLNNINYYIAGDTDKLDENMHIECDVAFVPVGGYYTMDYNEASILVNSIKPKIAVPIHYGSIVGDKDYGDKFINLLEDEIVGKIMLIN